MTLRAEPGNSNLEKSNETKLFYLKKKKKRRRRVKLQTETDLHLYQTIKDDWRSQINEMRAELNKLGMKARG